MSKTVGWAVGGAVVSITLGVLVGLVLHTGQTQRADHGQAPARISASQASVTGRTAVTSLPPEAPTTPTALPVSSSATASVVESVPPPPSAPDASVTSTADTASSSAIGGPATPVSSSTTGPATTSPHATMAPQPASDTAGAPCPTLADRSGDAAGTTLYCQVDQGDRTLRWRAVVDKGGCLNQSMTGIGVDGREYACRLDDSGRNHWALAD